MKFVEIQDGLSINIDNIIAIESTGELTSKVFTLSNIFEANFPKKVLIKLIEEENVTETQSKEDLFKDMATFFKQAGHFAG